MLLALLSETGVVSVDEVYGLRRSAATVESVTAIAPDHGYAQPSHFLPPSYGATGKPLLRLNVYDASAATPSSRPTMRSVSSATMAGRDDDRTSA